MKLNCCIIAIQKDEYNVEHWIDYHLNYGFTHIYLIDNKDVYLVVDSNPYKLDSIPSGTIFLFNGDTIPEGYKICNGEDNTPNITFTDFPDIKYIIKI